MESVDVAADEQQHPFEVGAEESGIDVGSSHTSNGATKHIVNLHGLPWNVTEEEIIKFLEGSTVVSDEKGIHFVLGDDGRRNGDAFVELATEDCMKNALEQNHKHIGKRYIDVYQVDRYEMEYVLKRSGSGPPTADDNDDAIVRLRGLPFGCTKEEIATFFLGLAIAPNGIVIVTDHEGRAAGDGFVRFTSPDLVAKALEKHKEKIGHRYIEVFRSSIHEMQKRAGRPPSLLSGRPSPYDRPDYDRYGGRSRSNLKGPYSGGYGGGGGGYYGGGYESRYESSRYSGGYSSGSSRYGRDSYSSRDRYGGGGYGGRSEYGGRGDYGADTEFVSRTGHYVFMRGLPYSATENEIYKFFSPVIPSRVVIEMNRDGRPSGNAFADFVSESDASAAMKKHKELIGNRYIELALNGMYGGYKGR